MVGLIDDNINAFKEALIEAVEASTEVRPMRMSNILVDDDEDFVYVLFSMTEAPLPGTGGKTTTRTTTTTTGGKAMGD